jgi:altronate hydrolase
VRQSLYFLPAKEDFSMEARALRVHPDDDVAALLSPAIAAGTVIRVPGVTVKTLSPVASGHKVALRPIAAGEPVKKFGWPFGRATQDIAAGEFIHTHNVSTLLNANESYEFVPYTPVLPETPQDAGKTFRGYVRADGRVGIRNEVWILCTVGCVNRAAEEAARRANAVIGKDFGNRIDGVFAHTHPYGCSQIGSDLARTRTALASLAAHPNCGGILLMGLGCENNQLEEQVESLRMGDRARLRYFSAQGEGDEIEQAVSLLYELAEQCASDERTEVSINRLVPGMKCGGSDGFSGLTANPLVGVLSDRFSDIGATSVLTEVPEFFGAERILMARAADEAAFWAITKQINDFKDYFRRYGEPISENPSPGNKAGGITTLEEKSLGCVQKGGARAPVTAVLRYGEALDQGKSTSGGIALVTGPGNDAVSCTALSAAGAQMVLFTTGRGTPFGTVTPTLKISTNSDLAHRKPHWIDFDAGRLIEEGAPMETLADELMNLVIAVASGEKRAKNEVNGYREMALFKDGVTE